MAAPTFQREGARIGGLTSDGISMVARTDSNGTRLFLDVYTDANRLRLFGSSSAGTLNAGNNYAATVRVTGLSAGRKYWWRARADDGTNSTNGDDATFSQGSFETPPAEGTWRIGFNACDPISQYVGYNTAKSPQMWQQLKKLRLNQVISLGDFYYSDIGTNNATADYTSGAWRNPATDADATVAAYRTNFISSFDEFNRRGFYNFKADFFRDVPLSVMWDDHDRGWDDMSGSGTWTANQITRAANALQAGHELFMTLNAPYLEADGRTFTPGSTVADYWHQDIGPARIIVLNCRQFRDLRTAPDTPAKQMLGTVQEDWAFNKIATNPKEFLIVASPLMFDGYHGWSESTTDGWVSCSYQRDRLMDHIRAYGNPARTLLVEGDTHAGCVSQWEGDLWAVTAGNLWPDSGHGYINGWKGGASGRGGDLRVMRVNEPNTCVIDLTPTSMRVRLVELMTGRSAWTREFLL